MAEPKLRVPENVPGPFYVDSSCIDCDTCRCISPQHFHRAAEKGYSFIALQPMTDEEMERVEEAIDCCPVDAIGVDSEVNQE